MSPLTKLFVVLLVLVSIILTAGMVTFVNRIEPMNTKLGVAQQDLANAKALLAQRTNDAATQRAQLQQEIQAAKDEAAQLQTSIQQMKNDLAAREGQLASANTQVAQLTSANTSAAAALQTAEAAQAKLMEQVATLRTSGDDRMRQNADLGQRVNELTAQNAQLEKQRRNLAEQVTELQGKNEQAAKLLQDYGVSMAKLDQYRPGTGAGAPAINGVIRSRRNIAGQEYATISIGSQDQVTKGMQFKILDKETGQFLGMLTVDAVDANEALGHISADPNNLAQIKAGNLVKTQI